MCRLHAEQGMARESSTRWMFREFRLVRHLTPEFMKPEWGISSRVVSVVMLDGLVAGADLATVDLSSWIRKARSLKCWRACGTRCAGTGL